MSAVCSHCGVTPLYGDHAADCPARKHPDVELNARSPHHAGMPETEMPNDARTEPGEPSQAADQPRPAPQAKESSEQVYERIKREKGIGENPDITKLVDEFNERFFIVENRGGECCVCWEDEDKLGRFVAHQSFGNFHHRFMHQRIKIADGKNGPIRQDKATIWLNNQRREQYESLVFLPTEGHPYFHNGKRYHNLWRGFAVEPKKGDCSLYLSHLRENVCNEESVKYRYLIRWMAHAVRHPDQQGQAAIAVNGPQGVGKNVFAEGFSNLYGHHAIVVNSESRVTGNFNAHLHDKCVLIADEAFFAGDPRQVRTLKTLITGNTLVIEPKGVDSFVAPNLLHIIILGNDEQLIRAACDERRYLALTCGAKHQNDQPYFVAIKQQLKNGGSAALLHHLLYEVDLTGFEPYNPPHTDELRKQQADSTTGGLDVIRECLTTGCLPGKHGSDGTVKVSLSDLADWASKKRPREWGRVNYNSFKNIVGKNGLCLERDKPKRDGKQSRCFVFPPLDQCRATWDKVFFRIDWPDDGDVWEKPEVPF